MDPLSTAASIIALIQASAAVGKGLKILLSLRHAPADFCELVDELTALQGVIEQVKSPLQELGKGDIALPALNVVPTLALKQDLESIQEELLALCHRLTGTKSGDEMSGQLRVSMSRWIRERSNVAKLRCKASKTNTSLILCFGALISSQSSHHARAILEVRQLIEASFMTLEEEGRIHRQMQIMNQADLNDIKVSLNQMLAKTLQPEDSMQGRDQPSIVMSNGLRYIKTGGIPFGSVQKPVGRKCTSYCKCQCHRHSRLQTPTWLRLILGTLFLEFNRKSLLGPRKCDLETCDGAPDSTRMIYIFPQWFLLRALFVAASRDSLTGIGSSIHLRIPRIIPRDQMISIVYNFDIDWIKRGIINSTVLPTDIDEDGNSLLMISLRDVNLTLSEFLVEQGWPLHTENVTRWTAASRSRMLYYAAKQSQIQSLKPEHGRMLEQLTFSQEVETSSLIHDAMLGTVPTSLSDAITLARSDIDGLDSYGWCPLHWAIYLADYASFDMLLYRGASLETTTRNGWTPLHYAARYESPGSVRMTKALLDAGANVDAKIDNYRGSKGETAIMFAFDNPDVVDLLLQRGSALVVETDTNWVCPLSYRARRTSNVSRWDPRRAYWDRSLDLLCNAGMDLNVPSKQRGFEGRTPIHDTILWRNAALLELLIQHGARLDAVDKKGSGMLHFAAQSANQELIDILSDARIRGLNPDQANAAGDTPMKIMTARLYSKEDSRQPGETVPTFDEWLAFKNILEEIRERNLEDFLSGRKCMDIVDDVSSSGISSSTSDDVD
ncbi:ankyrin repeat-containing domain protein [Colletotrichum lupini]|nr:ankyrin repeat-containing domain protein [Colletotrichum lupini]